MEIGQAIGVVIFLGMVYLSWMMHRDIHSILKRLADALPEGHRLYADVQKNYLTLKDWSRVTHLLAAGLGVACLAVQIGDHWFKIYWYQDSNRGLDWGRMLFMPLFLAFMAYFIFFPFLFKRASLLQTALTNSTKLVDGEYAEPFVLYLRDRFGERRKKNIIVHPQAPSDWIPFQIGISRFRQALRDRLRIYALWDSGDVRLDFIQFDPVLSTNERWQTDIQVLCLRASLIVIDAEVDSPGILWEINFIKDNSYLNKTIVICSSHDRLSHEVADVLSAARWQVQLPGRDINATTVYAPDGRVEALHTPLPLPDDLDAHIGALTSVTDGRSSI